MKTYHEYQSRSEVLLKEELSRILQFPLSLWEEQQMEKPELYELHRPGHRASAQSTRRTSTGCPPAPSPSEEPREELTRTGSTRRPPGRDVRFMAAIFCRVSTAAGTFPAETL